MVLPGELSLPFPALHPVEFAPHLRSCTEMARKNLTLPQELVESSIDYLWSDQKTLKAACLVSRAWVPACRTHLFHRIVLHWCDGGSRRSDSLYTLLLSSPTIANYIHEISVHEGLVSSEHSQITFCFAQSASLPNLLRLLPRLHLFEFRASALTHWSELSVELDRAVSHVASHPTLTELILGSWNFSSQPKALAAILGVTTKHVKALSLTDIVTSVVPEDYLEVGVPASRDVMGRGRLSLRSLSINDGAASLVPFFSRWCAVNLNTVKRLQLSCSTNQTSVSDLLRVLGESLEHLDLEFRALHDNAPVDLQYNVRLKSLHVQASGQPLMPFRGNISVPWIVDVLSTIRSFSELELVCLCFGINADRLRRLSQSDSDYWRHLDKILSPGRYSRLHTVQIGIKFHCHNGSEYIEEARQNMYNLADAGILDMYWETRRFCCADYC